MRQGRGGLPRWGRAFAGGAFGAEASSAPSFKPCTPWTNVTCEPARNHRRAVAPTPPPIHCRGPLHRPAPRSLFATRLHTHSALLSFRPGPFAISRSVPPFARRTRPASPLPLPLLARPWLVHSAARRCQPHTPASAAQHGVYLSESVQTTASRPIHCPTANCHPRPRPRPPPSPSPPLCHLATIAINPPPTPSSRIGSCRLPTCRA